MEYYQFTFKTSTAAQSARALLQKVGISTTLRRTSQELSARGCGFLLQVQWMYGQRAIRTMKEMGVSFQKAIYVSSNGMKREVQV